MYAGLDLIPTFQDLSHLCEQMSYNTHIMLSYERFKGIELEDESVRKW